MKDGDLLGASELQDGIAAYAASFPEGHPVEKIGERLSEALGQSLRSGAVPPRAYLSAGFDLMRAAARRRTADADLAAAISEWEASAPTNAAKGDAAVSAPLKTAEKAEANPRAAGKGGKAEAGGGSPKASAKTEIAGVGKASGVFSHDSEAFRIFMLEAGERLTEAEDRCIHLENDPEDAASCDELFRIFHTFKGECGFFRLSTIGGLAHSLENLLDLIRKRDLKINREIIDLLLQGIDRFKALLDNLQNQDVTILNPVDVSDLETRISEVLNRDHLSIGEKLVNSGLISEAERVEILYKQKEASYTKKFGDLVVENRLASKNEVEAALSAGPAVKRSDERFIKVRASQIDYLVDMIGELIIVQNQLKARDHDLAPLRKITKEIQNAALVLRTTNIKGLSVSVHRALRDVAEKLGKKIEYRGLGEELEIDRNLVEDLSEPLLHLVRNAASHGIESPEERRAAGKSEIGLISFIAERRGNSIIVGIEDDGRGLNRELILNKAVSIGLVDQAKASAMTDKEAYELIFLPGFSTASDVGMISGRGVGMDIVKNFALARRGRVETATEAGRFTRFLLHFPVSTAIIDAMLVKVGRLSFALPVQNVIEAFDLRGARRHELGKGTDVVDLRGTVLPIIDLDRYFGEKTEEANRRMGVVIEDAAGKRYVFSVASVLGKRETVIKSLGKLLRGVKAVSSGTVLPGGEVGYIIDIDTIVRDETGT